MAFRIEARIAALLVVSAFGAAAQDAEVWHKHFRHGQMGQFQVNRGSISFTETGKGEMHSRSWKYEDIQQIELSPERLRILTYEDQKWKLGLDREYVFEQLPEGFVQSVYELWRDRLDQRFVASLSDGRLEAILQIPAKLLGTFRGSQGTLTIASDRIVYKTEKAGESRTWRFSDIDNIASAGQFDFSVVTGEHHGATNSGSREFRFQLKRPLARARYDEIWRLLNASKQSEFIRGQSEAGLRAPLQGTALPHAPKL